MARPRSFDEAEVLRTARDQFWSTGYAATSLDDVMQATGLGKGSLYGAFGDKHQLFLRVFDEYCAGLVRAVTRALEGPDDQAAERLRAHVRAVAASTAADSDHRGCLLANGTAELAGRDPAVSGSALRTLETIEDLFTASIEQAQRQGDVDVRGDPRQLASLLLATLRGIEALGKAGKSPAALQAIAETALTSILRA
jgi:TetR/AcrR family transcriptional repressor of nem operon